METQSQIKSRIDNPLNIFPNALKALIAFGAATSQSGVSPRTFELVHLRASQINSCSVCVEMHADALKNMGETDARIFAVGAWRESPYFTDAERAAFALTEAATRLSDRPDAVSDEIWNDAARHYDERGLAALVIHIAGINAFNRINAATKQVAGPWIKSLNAQQPNGRAAAS